MKHIVIGLVAALAFCGGLAPSAFAVHGKQGFSPPKTHYRAKKNSNAFGGNYMAPKKQRRPTGYYRSSLTGKMVYGKH